MADENWKLLVESGVRSQYEKIYRVEIDDSLRSETDKRLVVIGPEKAANEVFALLQRASNELEREASSDKEKSTCDVLSGLLERLHDEGQRKKKSAVVSAEAWQLFKEYNALETLEDVYTVSIRAHESASKQVQLTLQGWNAERVARMLADPPLQMNVLEGVTDWLTSEGPRGTRLKDIRLASGALIKPSQDKKSLLLVGSTKATLAAKKIVESIVVETVTVAKLHFEFWFGHDGEDTRQRPHHILEDATNTSIGGDWESFMHVSGRPNNVQEAVERLWKSQYIKLRTQRVSMAVGNYVATIRPDLENDDRQIHLQYDPSKYPRTCELRRLHRVDSEQDDAKADEADHKLMQKIDIHEVVLDVPKWARTRRGEFAEVQRNAKCGLLSTDDVVNGRVLLTIAGSRTTVKRGREEVIKLLTGDGRYKEGAIRLRRIRDQSVDTAGFREAGPVSEEDVSNCAGAFDWERLTSEQWRYTGRPSSERKRKRSTNSEQSKSSRRADTNRE